MWKEKWRVIICFTTRFSQSFIVNKTGITYVLIRDFWHLNVCINVGILLVLRNISDLHIWCSTVCQHWLNWNAYEPCPYNAPLILHKESLHLCKQIQQTGTISGPCKGVKISVTYLLEMKSLLVSTIKVLICCAVYQGHALMRKADAPQGQIKRFTFKVGRSVYVVLLTHITFW